MQKLKENYRKNKKEIKKRLEDFSRVKKSDYFYELCFCLLTPQTNAKLCWNAVLEMKKNDFENKNIDPKEFIKKVRFYNNKTKYLLEMKSNYKNIFSELKKNPKETREWLVKNVKGMGLKEASHFLRNIGYRNLAILDRHILKNIKKYDIIKELPKTLSEKEYFKIEVKFDKFAKNIKIPIDELDLLFWSLETGEIFK